MSMILSVGLFYMRESLGGTATSYILFKLSLPIQVLQTDIFVITDQVFPFWSHLCRKVRDNEIQRDVFSSVYEISNVLPRPL